MAISKIVYKEDASATPVTWMDLTSDTVASSNLLSSYTAHGADGQAVSGAVGSGTEGTPTATKGTVSNHSISVTPSVTNTAGVISGGTHTGTAVTVSASELVSGSETKTANGTYDVTNLAELVVNVSGGGGSSRTVIGTFTGTTTGAAMDVTLNYSGSGYPIAVTIFPTGGIGGNSTYSTLIKRYALGVFSAVKDNTLYDSNYQSGTAGSYNRAYSARVYKNSTSDASNYNVNGQYNTLMWIDSDATRATPVYIRSRTKMSVFILESSAYGFAANIEYTYIITYSS